MLVIVPVMAAQAQDALYQTYPLNGFVLNPAQVGSTQSDAQLLHGWLGTNGIDGFNRFWNASAQAKLGKTGVGFQGFSQRVGFMNNQAYQSTLLQAYFSAARTLSNGATLRWGLVGGLGQARPDAGLPMVQNTRWFPTFGGGIWYQQKLTSVGISIPNVVRESGVLGQSPYRPVFITAEQQFNINPFQLYLGAVYKSYDERMGFRGLDLNARLWYRSVIGLGISAQQLVPETSGRRLLWILQAKPSEHWQISTSLGRYWQITNDRFYQVAVQYSWAK